jgi:predicted nuclease with TOPRIM domain
MSWQDIKSFEQELKECREHLQKVEALNAELLVIHKESAAFRERVVRLESLNAELLEALKQLYVMRSHTLNTAVRQQTVAYVSTSQCAAAFERAKQAIAKAEGQKP